jgi:hypothetical protein
LGGGGARGDGGFGECLNAVVLVQASTSSDKRIVTDFLSLDA